MASTTGGERPARLGRRMSETASVTTTDLFSSAAWQVLEEKIGRNTTKRYV